MSDVSAEQVVFRHLDEQEVEVLERLHRDVLVDAFSEGELDDAATMARGLREQGDPRLLTTVALGDDDEVLGGIVGEVYAREQVLLIAYLAVRPDLRGRGLGSALFRHAGLRWFADPAVRLTVAEVHDPRRWSGVAGEDPVGRLRLFERLGARVLAVPFTQPALRPAGVRSHGFLLLAFHVDPTLEVRGEREPALPSEFVGRFVRRYYEVSEESREPYDTELTRLLAVIDERPTIELLPVAGYERVPLLTTEEY